MAVQFKSVGLSSLHTCTQACTHIHRNLKSIHINLRDPSFPPHSEQPVTLNTPGLFVAYLWVVTEHTQLFMVGWNKSCLASLYCPGWKGDPLKTSLSEPRLKDRTCMFLQIPRVHEIAAEGKILVFFMKVIALLVYCV